MLFLIFITSSIAIWLLYVTLYFKNRRLLRFWLTIPGARKKDMPIEAQDSLIQLAILCYGFWVAYWLIVGLNALYEHMF
jgi:hypothetical protein